MAERVQNVRGTTPNQDAFTGLEGEVTVDITKREIRLQDGSTLGGIPHARSDLANVAAATVANDGKMTAAQVTQLSSNATNITDNRTDIDTNTANIVINVNDIGVNASQIDVNTTAIGVLETDLTQAEVDIAQNTTDIGTNDTDIASNAAAITNLDNATAKKSANLSDLTNVATARSNLGLGDAAVENVAVDGVGDLLRIDGDGSNLIGITDTGAAILAALGMDVGTADESNEWTSSVTWTKNASVTSRSVSLGIFTGAGGGGGGGGEINGGDFGGGGGQGGGTVIALFKTDMLGATESVVIGNGGIAGIRGSNSQPGNPGGKGGVTSFGGILYVAGGLGGNGGGNTNRGVVNIDIDQIGELFLFYPTTGVIILDKIIGGKGGAGNNGDNVIRSDSHGYRSRFGSGGGGGGGAQTVGFPNSGGGDGGGLQANLTTLTDGGANGGTSAGANGSTGIVNAFNGTGGGGGAANSGGTAGNGGTGGAAGGGAGGGGAVNGTPGNGGTGGKGRGWFYTWFDGV